MSGGAVKYKAKYDFTATQSGTLSFKAGDVFVFVSKSSEDWWSVRTGNGSIGMVPATYLEELKEQGLSKDLVPVTYKAVYDYTGANSSQLTFKQGDKMVLVDTPSSGWWSMKHAASGKLGLVPANYVEKVTGATSNGTATSTNASTASGAEDQEEKARAEVLLSIDRAIEAIHVETTKAGDQVTAQQRAALTRLLQHRQQTLATGKPEHLVLETTSLAPGNTRAVSPPTTSLPSSTPPTTTLPSSTPPTTTLPSSTIPSSTPPTTSSGRQSVYIPSQESGDSGDAHQRSSAPLRRQAPPPPKRDERYTLSTPRSPSISQASSPRTSTYSEREAISEPSLSSTTPTPSSTTSTMKTQSGPAMAPGGRASPASPLHASQHSVGAKADTSHPKPSLGEGKGSGSADEVVAMLSSFCDDLVISMETEIKAIDSAPGSPFRTRTLSNPRRSPSSRRESYPTPAEPLLPPVPGVNEDAVLMTTTMPKATPTTAAPVVAAPTAVTLATPTTAASMVTPAATPTAVATPTVVATPTAAATPTAVATPTVVATPTAAATPTVVPVAPPPPPLRTQFTDQEASELVEAVRVGTGMSYKNTLIAVNAVLDFLKSKVPQSAEMVAGLLQSLQSSQAGVSTISDGQLVSRDVERLREAFFQLKDCKDDTQQRGWAVHDDHHIILGYLKELLQLLCDADPDISRRVIKEDKYENVLTLIEFYHLEPRVPLRLLMLKTFAALCELDPTVVGILLSSVLPNELGRDIQQGIAETEKALYSSTVCTIVFSTGEAVPLSVYDQWNKDYILFLLDSIELPPPSDRQEVLPDAFMNVILSFNQHFQDPSTNIVMTALKERPNPKAFSEKLMLLVNRGEDPVAGHSDPSSLLKIVLDIFSDRATSGIFYTTDLMVLIDIIHRQLSDLEAGSKTRTHYLELLCRVLGTTDYTDHNRRQRELTSCLSRIVREDMEESERDREVVTRIHTAFPMLFEESTVV